MEDYQVIQDMCVQAAADPAILRAAISECDPVIAALVLSSLTGDNKPLEAMAPHIEGGWSFEQFVPVDIAQAVQDKLIEAINGIAEGRIPAINALDSGKIQAALSLAVNAKVPLSYANMMLEEMPISGDDPRKVEIGPVENSMQVTYEVVIVGAGLSGICLGIKLKEAGIPFKIFEKNSDIGGTWLENHYPGAAVDVPSHFYSFAFAPNPDWQYHFARQGETLEYLRKLVSENDLIDHIQFGRSVEAAHWFEEDGYWNISINDANGEKRVETATFFVSAVGQLNRPSVPNIPGSEIFSGQAFHTAQWPDDIDLTGKRVALLGTGASAIQVGPAIADKVKSLTVFQRSPNWAAPNPNLQKQFNAGEKWASAHIPYYQKWSRFLIFWASGDVLHDSLQKDETWAHQERSLNAKNEAMRIRLTDYLKKELDGREDLIEKALPDYPPYGKRMLRDTGWYRMLLRDNVDLVASGVSKMTENTIMDSEGAHHQIDICIFSTGFKSLEMLAPMEVVGSDGKTLNETWEDEGARAYLGIYVPGFPNFFMMYGPNTNLAHGGSLYLHAEWQTRHILNAMSECFRRNAKAFTVRHTTYETYNERVDEAHNAMVWTHPGMRNWYRNEKGRVVTNSPWKLVDYWQMTKDFTPEEFEWQEFSNVPLKEVEATHN